MSFSVRISATSGKDGKELLYLEPRWWEARDLMDDPRFVISRTAGYVDLDADVSLEEFRELHERFKPNAVTGLWGGEAWKEIIPPQLEAIEGVIGSAAETDARFHVRVFEWESGY